MAVNQALALPALHAPAILSRRRLVTISAATATIAVLPAPANFIMSEAHAASWVESLVSGTKWLAEHAMGSGALNAITDWIGSTATEWFRGPSYHDRWSYPLQFSAQYPLNQTGYGTYFGVDGHPVLTNQNRFEQNSDLNWAEVNGLAIQQTNPALFTGGARPRLLPGFTGDRRPATQDDADDVAGLIQHDPTLAQAQYGLSYVRDFCTCNGNMRGYAMLTANNPNANDFKFRLYKT